MNPLDFERVLCDTLWEIKQKYKNLEISNDLHYINTFERLNYRGNGIEIIFKDNSVLKISIKGHKSVDSKY